MLQIGVTAFLSSTSHSCCEYCCGNCDFQDPMYLSPKGEGGCTWVNHQDSCVLFHLAVWMSGLCDVLLFVFVSCLFYLSLLLSFFVLFCFVLLVFQCGCLYRL